ncbi:MAG: hypothetical protein ABJ349_09345, partial [Hyphomicrobiales bacterium]
KRFSPVSPISDKRVKLVSRTRDLIHEVREQNTFRFHGIMVMHQLTFTAILDYKPADLGKADRFSKQKKLC